MPTTRSDRRALRRASVALLLLLPVSGCSDDDAPTPEPAPEQSDEAVHAPDVVRSLTRLLDRRAEAVRLDDRDAFLDGVAVADPAFQKDQETYFANLEQLPVGEFWYAVDPASLTRSGRDYWAEVDVTLELEGYDEVPVVTRDRYRFSQRKGRFRVSSVSDAAWESEHGVRAQPWDDGPVTVRYGSGVLGIFDDGSAPKAGDVVADVETGIADVSARVPYDWEPRVVVYALSDPAFLSGLEDVPGDDPLSLDGIAFPVPASPDGGRTADTRFLLSPRMVDARGEARARLIRHELTHVAVGSRADGVPTWLSEGIAEYVSVRPIRPEDRVLSEDALDAAEASITRMPADEDFEGPDREVSYGVAWWACEYVAATYGEDLLWFLMESVGSDDDPDAALESTLGFGTNALARRGAKLMLQRYRPEPAASSSPSGSPSASASGSASGSPSGSPTD